MRPPIVYKHDNVLISQFKVSSGCIEESLKNTCNVINTSKCYIELRCAYSKASDISIRKFRKIPSDFNFTYINVSIIKFLWGTIRC